MSEPSRWHLLWVFPYQLAMEIVYIIVILPTGWLWRAITGRKKKVVMFECYILGCLFRMNE